MSQDLASIILVLSVAFAVAIAARRLRLPYTVGLALVGVALAFFHVSFGVQLTHELIFDLILPPLLFEAALNLHWRDLRADLTPTLLLSTLGTILSAAVTAAAMILLLGWPPASAIVFGTLISATDPVAVIAMFKDNGVGGRLRLLVESESLFNDGVAAVLFVAALDWATVANAAPTLGGVAANLAISACGGAIVGLVVAGLAVVAAGRTSEHLVEAALTTVVAYASFLIAERLHVSGVLATVAAGLIMGNLNAFGERPQNSGFSDEGLAFALGFWEFAAFLANSFIFPLIGASIGAIVFDAPPTAILAAIPIVLVSRAATVYPICGLLRWSRWSIPAREQHVLWWGGLRGALALALCLSLPADLPRRDDIVVATFAIAAFSIVLQGLTMPLLLRRLGFLQR